MLRPRDLVDMEPEGSYPGALRSITEGDYTDLDIVPGNERELEHLEGSVWNTDEQIFFTDYHNKVLAPWMAASNEFFQEETLLVHLDGHRDDHQIDAYQEELESELLRDNAEEVVDIAHIADIMTVADEMQMFDGTYYWGCLDEESSRRINSLGEMDPDLQEYERIVLDVDLDFFEGLRKHPPADNREKRDYYAAVAELEEQADMITYATSPGFISQAEAIEHLEGIRSFST